MGECLIGVIDEVGEDVSENRIDIVGVVLIYSQEPSGILMRVRHDVNSHWPFCLIVHLIFLVLSFHLKEALFSKVLLLGVIRTS